MDGELLQKFKDRRISIYNLHVPLDNFGEYSTSVTLAKAVDVKPGKAFGPYFGSLCGVFGKTSIVTVQDLKTKYEEAVRHEVKLYNYGTDEIKDGMVAVIGGGGNMIEMLEEIKKEGVNTFVTGISSVNYHSKASHEFTEKNKINILGGTHYSSEKFACIAMVDYFKREKLDSEFVEDEAVMEDM